MRTARSKADAIGAEIVTARKALRSEELASAEEKVRERARISTMEAVRDNIEFELLKRRRALRQLVNDNIDRIEASLAIRPEVCPLFTLRWRVLG